jgi:hypothetical protein
MERKAKVELFEQIRREYEFGVGTIGFEFTMEPRALQLHVWDDSYGLISHLSYIPAGYEEIAVLGNLTDEARAELLARNRRDYQEFCEVEYDRSTSC